MDSKVIISPAKINCSREVQLANPMIKDETKDKQSLLSYAIITQIFSQNMPPTSEKQT